MLKPGDVDSHCAWRMDACNRPDQAFDASQLARRVAALPMGRGARSTMRRMARSRIRIASTLWSRALLLRYHAARVNCASRHERTVLT